MKKHVFTRLALCLLVLVVAGSACFGVMAAKKVTIKFFSNLPDRTSGQGRLEQMLVERYMAENPNVEVKIEALQDEPYKQKFRVYVAGNQLPDLFMVWGQPSFFNPIMKGGYAAELNPKDYKDYDFFPGSLNGFSMNGRLYGLARITDLMVLYYNKAIFKENGVKVPSNYEELLAATKAFRKKGIAPCAINGRDQWTLNILYQDLVVKESGDQNLLNDALAQKVKFAENKSLLAAAKDFKDLVDLGFFQDSFIAADYGSARNLFAQERAVMFYMGSWEVGMATDENLSASFRKNLSAIAFPGMKKGKTTDVMAWNGGGYAVSANSKVKKEAIKLLNYMMRPENWAKNAWQMGLAIPAQRYDRFMTGKETALQVKLTKILNNVTSTSGTPWNDAATPQFKTDSQTLIQEFAAGLCTPEEFLRRCDRISQEALAE